MGVPATRSDQALRARTVVERSRTIDSGHSVSRHRTGGGPPADRSAAPRAPCDRHTLAAAGPHEAVQRGCAGQVAVRRDGGCGQDVPGSAERETAGRGLPVSWRHLRACGERALRQYGAGDHAGHAVPDTDGPAGGSPPARRRAAVQGPVQGDPRTARVTASSHRGRPPRRGRTARDVPAHDQETPAGPRRARG